MAFTQPFKYCDRCIPWERGGVGTDSLPDTKVYRKTKPGCETVWNMGAGRVAKRTADGKLQYAKSEKGSSHGGDPLSAEPEHGNLSDDSNDAHDGTDERERATDDDGLVTELDASSVGDTQPIEDHTPIAD